MGLSECTCSVLYCALLCGRREWRELRHIWKIIIDVKMTILLALLCQIPAFIPPIKIQPISAQLPLINMPKAAEKWSKEMAKLISLVPGSNVPTIQTRLIRGGVQLERKCKSCGSPSSHRDVNARKIGLVWMQATLRYRNSTNTTQR